MILARLCRGGCFSPPAFRPRLVRDFAVHRICGNLKIALDGNLACGENYIDGEFFRGTEHREG